MIETERIRVLIVDDSKTVREIVKALLSADNSIEVVGEAANGKEALEEVVEKGPDVIILDLRMPEMDGLEVTEWVMANRPTPILVLTSAIDMDEKFTTFETLSRGALDIVEKPRLSRGDNWEEMGRLLRNKVKLLKGIRVIPHVRPKIRLGRSRVNLNLGKKEIVGIAASTGGPQLLRRILENLDKDYPLPILIVQHITPGFDKNFAEWLGSLTRLKVKLAESGETLQDGKVLVAPNGYHMLVDRRGRISLLDGYPINNHKPSADPLFESIAASFGNKAAGIILSGMGRDGARGLKSLRDRGGLTMALREEECAVFGMSKAAYEEGAVDKFSSLEEIIETIRNAGKIE